MLTSYHNHTPLCRHSTGTEEEFVIHAIKNGYTVFGFSDHAPHCITDLLHASRMSQHELAFYVGEINRLKEKYKNDIEIHVGLELEYLPDYHETNMKMYREAGIEYLILGQHLLGNGRLPEAINSFAETSNNRDYTAYVNQTIEAMNTGDFCYFAHPDVFKYRGDDDFYRAESERLIRAAISHGIPLEVNMYGLAEGRHYPNPLFWEVAGRLGAKVILGRDAHSVARVHCNEEFPRAYAFVEKHGLDLIDKIEMP